MTLTKRRWLYNSFIIVFIVAGAALLFYLQGYRLSPPQWQIEKTGAIQATTEPANAQISLNGELFKRLTPTTILSLRPADYEVELKTPGYQTWKKTLRVAPAEVTFTGEVTLWPEANSGTSLNVNGLADSYLAPNHANLLYIVKNGASKELWLLNIKSGTPRLLARNADSLIINIEWSSSSREFLIQEKINNQNSWRIFSVENNEWEELSLPTDLLVNLMHWGEEKNLLYAATTDELYLINRRLHSTKLIWREKIIDFREADGLLFCLTRGYNDSLNLKIFNPSDLHTIPLAETPTLTNSSVFLTSSSSWLPLFDADRHYLYLLHSPLTESKPIRTIPEVTTVGSISDSSLIITNNFEIWSYVFDDDAPKFIERLSTSLSGAWQFADKPYVIFYTGKEVWVVEMDNRGERQRWLIGKYDQDITDIFVSSEADSLIIQTTNNLYKTELKPSLLPSWQPVGSPLTRIQKYLHLSSRP